MALAAARLVYGAVNEVYRKAHNRAADNVRDQGHNTDLAMHTSLGGWRFLATANRTTKYSGATLHQQAARKAK